MTMMASLYNYCPEPAVCVCNTDKVEYCEVCKCWTDGCEACGVPEPECSCTWIDADRVDVSTCHLHDSRSDYNVLMRRHNARKAAIAMPRKPATAFCYDCKQPETACNCDPFAVRRSA